MVCCRPILVEGRAGLEPDSRPGRWIGDEGRRTIAFRGNARFARHENKLAQLTSAEAEVASLRNPLKAILTEALVR